MWWKLTGRVRPWEISSSALQKLLCACGTMAEDLASPPPAKRRCAEPEAGEEDPQTLLVSRDEQNNDDDDATKPLIEPSEPVKV